MEFVIVSGMSGAGKSTLIRAVSQTAAYTGRIELEGRDIRRFRPAQMARPLFSC